MVSQYSRKFNNNVGQYDGLLHMHAFRQQLLQEKGIFNDSYGLLQLHAPRQQLLRVGLVETPTWSGAADVKSRCIPVVALGEPASIQA